MTTNEGRLAFAACIQDTVYPVSGGRGIANRINAAFWEGSNLDKATKKAVHQDEAEACL
jgi:hypothetical protein